MFYFYVIKKNNLNTMGHLKRNSTCGTYEGSFALNFASIEF